MRQHGGYTVLAVVLALVGIALVGINKVCLDKMNRYHAIARGDIYSEIMRACPPHLRQMARTAQRADARARPQRGSRCARMRRRRWCVPAHGCFCPLAGGLRGWLVAQFASFTIKFYIIKSLFTFTAVVRRLALHRLAFGLQG